VDDVEWFRRVVEWIPSPLYREFGPVVAADPSMLELIAQRRPGPNPVTLFFGAVHDLLLAGARHDLAAFYPSVVGADARPPAGAGPVFADFVHGHRDELAALIRVRLVQRHAVARAALLRVGMWAVGREVSGPVHLVEVGASAGALLRFDRYRYDIGGREFGDPASPVLISPEWRDSQPPPDLDNVPPVASAVGVDLNPVDPTDPIQRRWLHALVWPDDQAEHALLDTALTALAADPPTVIAGDAIDVCPALAAQLPDGEPRVVFHAATRMHVPADRQGAFDQAVASLADTGPLYHLYLEPLDFDGLVLRTPDRHIPLVRADGYAKWLGPLVA
jgi:hypothetical protein